MPEDSLSKTVVVCDTQPVTAEGLRKLVSESPDLQFLEPLDSLPAAMKLVHASPLTWWWWTRVSAWAAVLDWIHELKLTGATPAVVVWGVSMTEAEALRLLQAGARGIIRKTADLQSLMSCLRSVAGGQTWMEESVFRESSRQSDGYPRSDLTAREQQVSSWWSRASRTRRSRSNWAFVPAPSKST